MMRHILIRRLVVVLGVVFALVVAAFSWLRNGV